MTWLFLLLVVTAAEGTAVYIWLSESAATDDPINWWILVLFAGETVETGSVSLLLKRLSGRQPPGDPLGIDRQHRRLAVKFFIASQAEIAIWASWAWVAFEYGQEEAALFLLVLMHLKHQWEAAAVGDHPFTHALFSAPTLIASTVEVTGAVGCLLLLEEGEPLVAAVVLVLGLLIEHAILVYALLRAQKERGDLGIPVPSRPPSPLDVRIAGFFASRFRGMWRLIEGIGPLRRLVNRLAINALVNRAPPRPNPFSTKGDYTSWASLTDKTYSGLHLPPRNTGIPDPPSARDAAAIFARETFVPCPKSTMLFAGFAQWFVDGFLRTQRDDERGGLRLRRDTRRNESTHDVDLSQLYGLNDAAQSALRKFQGGRLDSTMINGEEYPPRLCEHGQIKPRYRYALMTPFRFDQIDLAKRAQLFAMGTDVRNVGFVAFNVLFLREHNRIAGELAAANPDWDDERLFQTARMVLMVILMKIIVEEYINHITGAWFNLRLEPGGFEREPWVRPNWMAIEFDLLYRWHSLIPREIELGTQRLTPEASLMGNDVLTGMGLAAYMRASSEQRAGKITIANTDPFLVNGAERASIEQGRYALLRPYNDYRELCRLPRLYHFGEFSRDGTVGDRLRKLYGDVDNVEFFVGLFAEEAGPYDVLPPLMAAMVAFDAFSQITTNPLFAPEVYGPQTFSPRGMELIDETKGIRDLVRHNAPGFRDGDFISFTRRNYDGP